uniref:RNA-dependent RNA polymerase n=1 Tax=Hubei bunya-like virus 1 TaxID=1922842 RepID=A0A1L3KPK1_9VIRU|nr:RNA-dependent RNA polymerase [Hubei bunya-like virus 1]
MDLVGMLNNLNLPKPFTYHIPDSVLYHKMNVPELPSWDVQPVNTIIGVSQFNLKFPDLSPDRPGYSLNDEKVYTLNEKFNWNHDFTFEALAVSLDFRLDTVFQKKHDKGDAVTPDFIFTNQDGVVYVVEFTTNRSSNKEALVKSYEKKKIAYEDFLRERASYSKPVVFIIMVVSRDYVLTNLNTISQFEIDELCYRFLVSLDIRSKLERLGLLMTEKKENESVKIKKLKTIMSGVKVTKENLENYEPFNLEFVESLYKDPDTGYIKNTLEKIVKKSLNNVDNQGHQLFGEDRYNEMVELSKGKGVELIFMNKENKYDGLLQDEYTKLVDSKIQSYELSSREGNRRLNDDSKAIILTPFVLVRPTSDCSGEINDKINDLGPVFEDSTLNVWNLLSEKVVFKEYRDEEETADEIMQRMRQESSSKESAREYSKRKYRRVQIDMTDEDIVELGKIGIEGKKLIKSKNKQVISYREAKSLPFSIDAKGDDVDDLLLKHKEVFQYIPNETIHMKLVLRDLRDSSAIHHEQATEKNMKIVESILNTAIGNLASQISDIATELCISLKQHTKSGEFVLKKLKGRDIYLAIKPTRASEMIYFSIGWKNSDVIGSVDSTVFKKVKTNGIFSFVDFVSLDAAKLSNWVKAESMLIAIVSFWSEFYSAPLWDTSEPINKVRTEVLQMSILSFLIFMHDKSCVEQPITLSRYIGMEGFVTMPSFPNPQKMLDKFPNHFKSRLEVWIIRKMLKFIHYIGSGNVFMEKETKIMANDGTVGISKVWVNLLNPFLGTVLHSPDQVINLFYLGYLTNKEQKQHLNTAANIYTKIIEWEENKPKTYDYLGLKDPDFDEIQKHEFSASFIKRACLVAKETLRKTMGVEWEQALEDDILNDIIHLDIESFSTLKASSNFDESWHNFISKEDFNKMIKKQHVADLPEGLRTQINELPKTLTETERKQKLIKILSSFNYKPTSFYSRSKVIQNLNGIRKDKVDIFELIEDALSHCTNNGCLNIDLFQKVQYGLREIYVLGINERILQLIIERISKTICGKFESETMTNPRNKLNIPSNHTKLASSNFNRKFLTVSTADDAEKWNQGHFVTKFAILLCSLLPRYFHGFVISVLKLWMHKRIMIDPKLLEYVHQMDESKFYDEKVGSFFKVLKGEVKADWYIPNKTFIETQTGMMQGILHYTSSLYHSVLLNYVSHLTMNLSRNKAFRLSTSVLVSHMQSSDDSAMLISGGASDDKGSINFLKFARVCFYIKDFLSLMFGVYRSIKSTSQLLKTLEFNSEFFVGGNLFRPTLRWIAASLTMSEQECVSARQEQFSSLLTQVLEGGGSLLTCSLIQWAQGLLHYRLLGSSVSKVFLHYSNYMNISKDPSLGFFLMDHPLCSGLLGFPYNLWLTVRKTQLGKKYKFYVMNLKNASDYVKEGRKKLYTLENTQSGAFLHSTAIMWGNREKFKRFKESLNLDEEWLEKIDESPEILYRKANNKVELDLKYACKVYSPGVSESLSKGNVLSRVISSSVYILTEDVLHKNEGWLNWNEEDHSKYSLLRALIEDASLLGSGESVDSISTKDLQSIFPNHFEFEKANSLLNSLSEYSMTQKPIRESKNRVKVEIYENDYLQVMKPEHLIMWKWFGIDNLGASIRVKEYYWGELTTTYQWLRSTPKETLKDPDCPFIHHTQIRNFFSRLDRKQRVVNLTGTPVSGFYGKAYFMSVISNDYFPGYKINPHGERTHSASDSINSLSHCLRLIQIGPYAYEAKSKLVTECLRNWEDIETTVVGRSRKTMLSIMKEFCSYNSGRTVTNSHQVRKLVDRVIVQKMGTIGYYDIRQKFKENRYIGRGKWNGLMDGVNVEINMMGDENCNSITSVIIDDTRHLDRTFSLLKQFCRDTNVVNKKVVRDRFSPRRLSHRRVGFLSNFHLTENDEYPPIYCDQQMKNIPECEDLSLSLKLSNFGLNLMASFDKGSLSGRAYETKTYSIFNMTLKDSDVSLMTNTTTIKRNIDCSKSPLKEWLLLQSMGHQNLTNWVRYVNNSKDKRFTKIFTDNEIFRTLLSCTLSRILGSVLQTESNKDIPKEKTQIDTIEVDDLDLTSSDSEDILDLDIDFSDGEFDYLIEDAQDKAPPQGELGYFDEFSGIIDSVFLSGPDSENSMADLFVDVEKKACSLGVLSYHPFLDDFINQIIKDTNRATTELLFKNNIYTDVTENLVDVIASLKGIEMSDFKSYKEYMKELKRSEEPNREDVYG